MKETQIKSMGDDFIPGSTSYVGANSEKGFVGFYPEWTKKVKTKRIYCIEGGPGTGKSYTMKLIADACDASGFDVERGYCSSDPTSLDAVRIRTKSTREQILLLDSTAPHLYGGMAPGAITRTVDFGRFRDDKALEKQTETILRLENEKRESYETAYRFLGAEGVLQKARREELETLLDGEKMKDASRRLFLGAFGEGGFSVTRTIEAVSMRGRQVLMPKPNGETRVFSVEDVYGSSEAFLDAVHEEAVLRRMTVFAYCAASSQGRLLALRIPDVSLLLVADTLDASARSVHTLRFFDRARLAEKRSVLRACEKEAQSLRWLAGKELEKAGKAHFALESIYGQAMDFQKKNEEDERLVDEILTLANE